MVGFKTDDKKRFQDGKILTFRPLSCSIKGGKRYTLMCERVPGGFGSGYFEKPFIYDLKLLNDKIANLLGFETAAAYLAEEYNTNNKSSLRKAYIIKDIQLKEA